MFASRPVLREPVLWIISAFVLAGVYLWTAPSEWQCEGVDEIEYLALADSLQRGQGYTIYGEPYVVYPPMFSAVASLLIDGASGPRWSALYRLNAGMGLAALLLFCVWLRADHGRAGVIASWLALFSYYAWSFSTRYLMAEQLHFLLVAIALTLSARILRSERIRWVDGTLLIPACSLAMLTKASALALLAALSVAGAVHLIQVRRWRPVLVLALAAGLAGAWAIGWEVRAALLDPDAKESYGRWVLKWIGVSNETDGVIARNQGEGVDGPTTWVQRIGYVLDRIGQYTLSIPRTAPNHAAAAMCVAILLAAGLMSEMRKRPDSPLLWYTVISMLMMSATSWVSSYTRYLYPLTPLLYLWIAQGFGYLRDIQADSRRTRLWTIGSKLTGGAVLIWTAYAGWYAGNGPEGFYRSFWGLITAILGAGLIVLPCGACIPVVRRVRTALPVVCAVMMAANTGLLIAQRHQRTTEGNERSQRGIAGATAVGEAIRARTPADARIVSAIPRMAAFLSGREGIPASTARQEDWIWLMGPMPGNPAYRAGDEAELARRVRDGGWVRVAESGASVLYRPPRSTGPRPPE